MVEAHLFNVNGNLYMKIEDVLTDMHRGVNATMETISLAKELKNLGVIIATNVIIDYKDFTQDLTDIVELYDYVSWNPLWDGKWDRERAEQRFEKYIIGKYDPFSASRKRN